MQHAEVLGGGFWYSVSEKQPQHKRQQITKVKGNKNSILSTD